MLHNNLSSIRKQVTAFNFLNQDASCLLKLVSLTRKSLQFSHVGVCCWLTSETNGPNIQMWLSRVVTSSSLSPGQLCNVCARYLKREKRPSESDDIDSESGGRCRPADDVWGEEKRSSTSRKITPPSRDTSRSLAACVTSPSEDPSPSLRPRLLYTSHWISSDTFHYAFLLDVYRSLFFFPFSFLHLHQGLKACSATITSHISKH